VCSVYNVLFRGAKYESAVVIEGAGGRGREMLLLIITWCEITSCVGRFSDLTYASDRRARNLYKFLVQETCIKFLMQVSCTS